MLLKVSKYGHRPQTIEGDSGYRCSDILIVTLEDTYDVEFLKIVDPIIQNFLNQIVSAQITEDLFELFKLSTLRIMRNINERRGQVLTQQLKIIVNRKYTILINTLFLLTTNNAFQRNENKRTLSVLLMILNTPNSMRKFI